MTMNVKSQHASHPHGDDGCEDCTKQRTENNNLVDFYQRLETMDEKIIRIKQQINKQKTNYSEYRQKIHQMGLKLQQKPEENLKSIRQHNSKQMGYELATALIQRQIKAKNENQRLQMIIESLSQQNKLLQKQNLSIVSTNQSFQSLGQKEISLVDSIDEIHQASESDFQKHKHNNSFFIRTDNKRYWQQSSQGQQQTNFSNFSNPKARTFDSQQQNKYTGLNLWLYQYKPEEMQKSPIKSLRKSNKIYNKRQKV